MIKELQNYFADCPVLGSAAVNIDYLASRDGSVTIKTLECEPIIKRYRTGGSLRQYCFQIAIRCPYRGSPAESLKNEQLCEELAEWVEEQNDAENLPVLADGITAQRLEVTSGGYIIYEETNHARYQIGFRLVYTKI